MHKGERVRGTVFSNAELWRLIWPLLVEQILAVTVGMADVMMVSSVGEAAVSGVSLVDMVNVLILNIFAAMATGGAVVVSQKLGAKERENACHTAAQLLTAAFLLAVAVMVLVLCFQRPLVRLLFGAIDDDVMEACLVYLSISAWSYPFIALYNAGAAVFRSMGNSRISMYASVFMNVVNIGGNALCVYGLQMGVAGVAVPSLVARVLAAGVMLFLLKSRDNLVFVKYRFQELKPNFARLKQILRIAIPSALENSMFQLGRVLVVGMIAGFGTVQIAANGVANNLDNFGSIPGAALNLAVITVVGRCVGTKDMEQTKYYVKKLMLITLICMAVVNIPLLLGLPWVLSLYNLSPETMGLASTLIWIHNGLLIFFCVPGFALPNVLRAANDVRFPLIASASSMWVFRILFSYILGVHFGMGAIGVWYAMILDWACRAVCFTVRYFSGKWQRYALRESA